MDYYPGVTAIYETSHTGQRCIFDHHMFARFKEPKHASFIITPNSECCRPRCWPTDEMWVFDVQITGSRRQWIDILISTS